MKHADSRAECSDSKRTESARAKHLRSAPLTIRANRTLRDARERCAEILRAGLTHAKRLALASEMGVSEILVRRWLDPDQSDLKPVPLAAIFMLDDAEFDRVIEAIRNERKERR